MVFVSHHPGFASGERWVSREKFLAMAGADYFDRRALREWRKADRAARSAAWAARVRPSEEELEERRRKKLEYARNYARNLSREQAERRKEAARRSYLRLRDTEEYKQRKREATNRWLGKNKPNRRSLEEIRAVAAKREEARLAAKAERERLRAEKKAAREAAKREKVVLTPEQRRQRRREEKKNYKHRRRARLRGLEHRAKPSEIRAAMEQAGGVCCYCGSLAELTVDHVVPLARGGTHTLGNIAFACHPCNSAKRDLSADEFRASLA